MNPRLYRLIETHQRIDEALRLARLRRQWVEIARLTIRRLKVKQLIDRLGRQTALA